MRLSLAVACSAMVGVLAGCGGGDSEPSAPTGTPVTTTSQTVGASGGSVTLQGLRLALPAAALAEPVLVSLQQESVASPALARYRFSPAGQTLEQPAELRYSAAGLPPNVRFFWEVDGQRWMIPGTVSGGVLSSQVTSLGYNAAGSVPRAQAASLTERMTSAATRVRAKAAATEAGGGLVVAPVDCDSHVAELSIRLRRVATEGDQERAAGIFSDLVATKEACASARIQELERASCDALAQAQSNATVLLADNLNTFRSLTVPLVAAQGFVEVTGATCSNANPTANPALMEAKFDQLLDVMKGQMARAQFTDDLTVRDLDLIMHMDETFCQKVNLGSVCDRLTNELYPDLLDALRSSAFEACRTNGTPLAVSQLYALGSRAGDADKFYSHGRFSLDSVESDLNYCSNPSLGLRVFDGEAVPGELTDRATTLRPLVALGNYQKTRVIEVPRDGSLNIAGTVGVLRCPDGSASGADLVVRINGQEWVRRVASGNAYPLESAPLLLDLPEVLPDFGIDPVTNTGFTVTVNREGGACSDGDKAVLEAPFTLFEVRVNLPEDAASNAVTARTISLDTQIPFEYGSSMSQLREGMSGGFLTTVSQEITFDEKTIAVDVTSTADSVNEKGASAALRVHCSGYLLDRSNSHILIYGQGVYEVKFTISRATTINISGALSGAPDAGTADYFGGGLSGGVSIEKINVSPVENVPVYFKQLIIGFDGSGEIDFSDSLRLEPGNYNAHLGVSNYCLGANSVNGRFKLTIP